MPGIADRENGALSLNPFMETFTQPRTEAELWDVLEQHDNCSPLAGGTDLLVQLRIGKRRPGCIVDIKRLPVFAELDNRHGKLRIGAAVTLRDITQALASEPRMDALTGVCQLIGSRQIQNRATLGGNICNASPAADAVPLLIAMEARYVLVSRDGSRTLPAEDFATAPGQNQLRRNELLQCIDLPPSPGRTGDAFLRVTPRTEMDIAIASAGARIALDGSGCCTAARIAIGGVTPKPLLVHEAAEALVGTMLDTADLENFVRLVRLRADPIDDVRGTRAYRRHVVGILARRAAEKARDRAVAARIGETH